MTHSLEFLEQWLFKLACHIADENEPEPEEVLSFVHDPLIALHLLDLIDALPEENEEEKEDPYYSACVFAVDLCITQLQSSKESGQKLAERILNQFMEHFTKLLKLNHHSLGFWLPFLNAFYDAHLDFSEELRDAYFELAMQGEDLDIADDVDNLQIIEDMLSECNDLSIFDLADNFFAQSHGMPLDFYPDFIADLCTLPIGQDIAILALLHPKPEVRYLVVEILDALMADLQFSNRALTRLQAIKAWYPEATQQTMQEWIKMQRRKGVVFEKIEGKALVRIHASEVDGSGAQGIFVHLKTGRKNRICGMLFKAGLGIKDAWLTPQLSALEVKKYYQEAFNGMVTLHAVDKAYLDLMTEHFLAKMLEVHRMPNLHFLEIQEEIGQFFSPEALDTESLMAGLSVQISPFTEESIRASFKRSKAWLKNRSFTESWYVENANIDKLVNRCSRFLDGVKVCDIEEATTIVFAEEMETHRDNWLFHFLWITLWLKASVGKHKKTWQDSFIIAHAIANQMPLESIPVLKEIVHQTVLNSIETMTERRTHLNKE